MPAITKSFTLLCALFASLVLLVPLALPALPALSEVEGSEVEGSEVEGSPVEGSGTGGEDALPYSSPVNRPQTIPRYSCQASLAVTRFSALGK